MINFTIHGVTNITTKGIKEWEGDGKTYYSVDIVIDYDELGDNIAENNNEQWGTNKNSFQLTLFAETLQELEFKLRGVSRVVKN
tara:strand:- start:778 stop:1029 length:252 start_codon:yes stop_codon:yes gene_type:complete